MASCGTCRKPINEENETIKCSGKCQQIFHLVCTPIQSGANITKLGVRVDTWECPRCATQKPEETTESFVDEVVTRTVIEDIVAELKISSAQKTEAVIRELVELRKSVLVLSKQVDEFKHTVQTVEEEIERLQTENWRLQTRSGNVWRTVIRLGDDVSELQQLKLREGSMGVQGAREVASNDSSPKAVVALGLSYLSVAGVLCLIITRVFKRALKIISNDNDQTQL